MRLADILAEPRVTVRLGATDKPSALRAMAALLNRENGSWDEAEIVRVFEQREALASTGVGSGVAFPHGDLAQVESLTAAVGITPTGIDFEAIDGRPAQIFVALLGPARQRGQHLKALARFSKLLRSERVRNRLISAGDAHEAYTIIVDEDSAR